MILEYILLVVLLISAVSICLAVTLQKSAKDGLSGTIAGGAETYYGKDKSMRKNRLLNKWTLIIAIVFAVAVLVVYVIQPDYEYRAYIMDGWQDLTDYYSIFS